MASKELKELQAEIKKLTKKVDNLETKLSKHIGLMILRWMGITKLEVIINL